MTTETFIAHAVADAIGATKRQVQVWTDAGAVHCLLETDRQGRGRQRRYHLNELPSAALVAQLARQLLSIGVIRAWATICRERPGLLPLK